MVSLADLVMAALVCGLFSALFLSPRDAANPFVIFLLVGVVVGSWSHFRSQRQAPTCEECGRRFIQPTRILAVIGSFLLPGSGASDSGLSPWLRIPLLALAILAAILSGFVVIVVLLTMFRRRQVRSERGSLAMARKSAGREGEEVKEGPMSVWYSGPDDPTPMLREQMEAARRLISDNGGNLGPPAPTSADVIADRGAGPRVEWVEGCRPITAEEALAAEIAARRNEPTDAPERRHAEDWLREVLADGPVPAKELESAARNAGVAYHTLRDAKKSIGAGSFRVGFGKDSVGSWRPQNACTE